jgi:hypothetical protein
MLWVKLNKLEVNMRAKRFMKNTIFPGKRDKDKLISAQAVADYLDVDIQTVYRNAEALGGVKFARKWLFNKEIVKGRLFGELYGKQEEEKRQGDRLDGPGQKAGGQSVSSVRHKGRGTGPGSRVDSGDTADAGRNRHGLGLG